MKNKVISILLCLALAVSVLSVAALATENEPEVVGDPKLTIAPPETISPAFSTLCKVGEYAVNANYAQHGRVAAAADEKGVVTLTVTADKGWCLETVTVRDTEGTDMELTNNEDGTYTFPMAAGDVWVTATFVEDNTMLNYCMDVTWQDWYYDDVLYVYKNKLMGGTGNVAFSPKLATTRGMIATILYRMEGEPAFMNANIFNDVAEGAYYEKAVVWANGKNIVTGYADGTFKPNASITREQLATLLYRYAQYKGQGFVGSWMFLLDFSDAKQISSYANEAMHWCVMKGIINGVGEKILNPKGTANRAQVAAMLHKFAVVMADVKPAPELKENVLYYEDENYNTATLTAREDGTYAAEIGIYRLSTFEGTADCKDGTYSLVLTDPNGGEMKATFSPAQDGSYTLTFTASTWSLLEEGTSFEGFKLKG